MRVPRQSMGVQRARVANELARHVSTRSGLGAAQPQFGQEVHVWEECGPWGPCSGGLFGGLQRRACWRYYYPCDPLITIVEGARPCPPIIGSGTPVFV